MAGGDVGGREEGGLLRVVGDEWAAVARPEGTQGWGRSLCAESLVPQEITASRGTPC